MHRTLDCHQCCCGIACCKSAEQLIKMPGRLRRTTCSDNLVERRKRVARRTATCTYHVRTVVVGDIKTCVVHDVIDKPDDFIT